MSENEHLDHRQLTSLLQQAKRLMEPMFPEHSFQLERLPFIWVSTISVIAVGVDSDFHRVLESKNSLLIETFGLMRGAPWHGESPQLFAQYSILLNLINALSHHQWPDVSLCGGDLKWYGL